MPSDFVKKLEPFVVNKPICPGIGIGLGIPRDSIKILINNNREQDKYESLLKLSLKNSTRESSLINVFKYAFDYFSKVIESKEKVFFLIQKI